jgi:hypothetical protein
MEVLVLKIIQNRSRRKGQERKTVTKIYKKGTREGEITKETRKRRRRRNIIHGELL